MRSQALHFQVVDDVRAAIIGIGRDFGRVIGLPSGRPDHCPDLKFEYGFGFLQVNCAILAGVSDLFGVRRADHLRRDHVALWLGVFVR